MLQLFWILLLALIAASQGGSRCRKAVLAVKKPTNGQLLMCCRYKRIKFRCYPGFKLSGGDETMVCRGGRIYGRFPKCIPESNHTCGMAGFNPVGGRIVGGEVAAPGDWPWMATISLDGRFKCGGALISSTYIITAAHCFYNFVGVKINSPSRFKVWLGRTNLRKREGKKRQLAKIDKIFTHQEFSTVSYKHDIALIRLEKPVKFNRFVQPVCFPKEDKIYTRPGKISYVAGWGNTQKQPSDRRIGALSQRLKYTWLPVVRDNLCKSAALHFADYFADSMLCAGDGGGKRDACYGDSGGPLVVYEKVSGKDGKRVYKWTTVGIVSWGDGCAQKNTYGYFSRLSSYISWVKNIVGNTALD